MSEQTVHERTQMRSRRAIASYLRRMADAFDDGGPVPVDEEATVTVDPPAESELEVEVEREDEEMSLELEVAWPEAQGGVDIDAEPASKATFELYRDRADEWRWRLRHRNGNIIADSAQGYSKRANAEKGLESVRTNAAGAAVDRQD